MVEPSTHQSSVFSPFLSSPIMDPLLKIKMQESAWLGHCPSIYGLPVGRAHATMACTDKLPTNCGLNVYTLHRYV